MIKVFSTGRGGSEAADILNEQFENWKKEFGTNSIEIINFHTTSSQWGWRLTIHYKIIGF